MTDTLSCLSQTEMFEIVPSIMPLSIPGPFVGLHTWYLHFLVTRNGSTNEPPILEHEAGQMTDTEVNAASTSGLRSIEKNERRLDCIEKLTKDLEDSGFEFFDTGENWFSRRFRCTK